MSDSNRPNKTVFIVDDEVDLTNVLTHRLEANGYTVRAFNHPKDLLRHSYADKIIPDLFIVDLMMPEINGFELCKEIRADPRFKTTPILLLTAHSTREQKLLGFEHGVDEFMGKPYDSQELLTRIQNLLEKKETYRAEVEAERLKVLQETAVAVSHGMMTPLTAISLSVQQLKRTLAGSEVAKSVQEELDTIAEALSKIEALVYKLQRVSGVVTEEYFDGVSMINLDAAG